MEMESNLKSAESKSTSKLQQVFSNFWQLISMTKYTQAEEEEKGEHENEEENQSSSRRIFSPSVKNYSSKSSQTTPESESESSAIHEMATKDMLETGNLNSNSNLLPNLTTTNTRDSFETTKSADQLLRMIQRETQEEFYKLFECLKCQRQFNNLATGRRHVKLVHFQLGISCPTCYRKFFSKSSLELHILKCSKRDKQTKDSLNNGRRKAVKFHLRPHDEQTPDSAQNPTKKIKAQDEHLQNPRKILLLNPLEIKVRNPFPNFDIEKTLNAKVVVKRLRKNQEKGQLQKAPKNPKGKTQAQDELVKSPRKVGISDPLKIEVRNPLANFSLENAMNVKVVIKRVNIKNRNKPVSIISQVETIETEIGKSVETSCSSRD